MSKPTITQPVEDLASLIATTYGLTGGASEYENIKRAIRLARGYDGDMSEDPGVLAAKRWSRADFAARLDERIASGELDLDPVFAAMVVARITAQQASNLSDATEDDWALIDTIIDDTIADLPGA